MCGTKNNEDATSCKSCGYIFEDFSTSDVSNFASSVSTPEQPTATPPLDTDSFSDTSIPASTDSPLFVVSRSLLGSVLPLVIYLLFILFFGLLSSPVFIGLIAIFVLMTIVPVLTSPRKYEFYDSSLRIHKIIGGDSEIAYSNLTLYESPKGRRAQIVLAVEGQRRPMIISGNPMNNELREDLNQFLEKKLKKYNPKPSEQESTQDADAEDNTDAT
jgi:hypothetical protein